MSEADGQNVAIWNAVIAKLQAAQASGGALSYVATNSLYQGWSDKIPQGAFPVIIIEPETDDEAWILQQFKLKSIFKFKIVCMVKHSVFNKAVVGDANTVGILNMAKDVKNVLQADQTLGNITNLEKIRFPQTKYFFQDYPIREAQINIEAESILSSTGH